MHNSNNGFVLDIPTFPLDVIRILSVGAVFVVTFLVPKTKSPLV